MSKDGKTVMCTSGYDGEEVNHSVNRVLCLLDSRPACKICPHGDFDLVFQIRASDQVVACPRWENEDDRKNRRDPLDYVPIQRDICISQRPFPFCEECPNSKAGALPETEMRWFELRERMKRIERELDEEEQE